MRDRELGRLGPDIDVVVDDDPSTVAAAVAHRLDLPWFPLSREWGAYRVVGSPGHLDVAALRGGSLAADLSLRDFTVNAMALPVEGGPLVDPFEGRRDLSERRLVAVSRRVFVDDPLRLMRAVRLAHTLELGIDPALATLIQKDAWRLTGAAAERVLSEVISTLSVGRSAAAVCSWASLRLLDVFLPELKALHGVGQSPYHHRDVWGHTLAALEEMDVMLAAPGARFGSSWQTLEARLVLPIDGVMPRPVALRLAALLHDVAKPLTKVVDAEGRILFWGHTELGGPMAQEVCRRLRCSRAATSLVRRTVERHLDVGFLQHETPLSRRSAVGYLWATAPYEPEAILVSVADRLATRGPRTEEKHLTRHLAVAHALMDAWSERESRGIPPLPVHGEEVMGALDLPPGPLLGRVMREVALAWESGEVTDANDALAAARRYLQRLREPVAGDDAADAPS